MRVTGGIAGLTATSGVVSANQQTEANFEEAPLELVDSTTVEVNESTAFSVAKARNTDTDEVYEVIVKVGSGSFSVYEARLGATERIRSVAEDNTLAVTQGGWIELITEEIPNKAKDQVKRVASYGTEFNTCTALSGYGNHEMVGVSIEYNKDLNALSGGILGATVGGIGSYLATSYTGPAAVAIGLLGSVLGGVLGVIGGFVADTLKDTNILSITMTDWGVCGFGSCTPAVMLQGSGSWRDTNKDDQYQLGIDHGNHMYSPDYNPVF